ncbi:MAG TPA: hypothetical protein ENK67_02020 [Flavobacteriia bacterium]|nr:hypothetical protein [Flavobacteriia bacterium]
MKRITYILLIIIGFSFQNCGIYSFSGGSVGNAKTIQIDYFPNNASFVEPTLSNVFKVTLEDKFLSQTNLSLVKSNGDLYLNGEITDYRISPTAATADQTAAQNRLTIRVKVHFENRLDEEKNFDKTFSHFYDYAADKLLVGSVLDEAYSVILDRITQDVFNEALAQW